MEYIHEDFCLEHLLSTRSISDSFDGYHLYENSLHKICNTSQLFHHMSDCKKYVYNYNFQETHKKREGRCIQELLSYAAIQTTISDGTVLKATKPVMTPGEHSCRLVATHFQVKTLYCWWLFSLKGADCDSRSLCVLFDFRNSFNLIQIESDGS